MIADIVFMRSDKIKSQGHKRKISGVKEREKFILVRMCRRDFILKSRRAVTYNRRI